MSARPDPSRIDVAGATRAAATPAPAALMTIWGVLLIALLTTPIRPYTAGLWAGGDLLLLGLLGGSIALVSRPAAAAVGIALGMAATVTIQLFILAGQAVYQPVVAAAIDERTWTVAVAGALLVGVGAIALGYVVTRGSVGAIGALRAGRRSRSRRGSSTRRRQGCSSVTSPFQWRPWSPSACSSVVRCSPPPGRRTSHQSTK